MKYGVDGMDTVIGGNSKFIEITEPYSTKKSALVRCANGKRGGLVIAKLRIIAIYQESSLKESEELGQTVKFRAIRALDEHQ